MMTSESLTNSAAITDESPPSLSLPRVPIATKVEILADASRGRREKYAAREAEARVRLLLEIQFLITSSARGRPHLSASRRHKYKARSKSLQQ